MITASVFYRYVFPSFVHLNSERAKAQQAQDATGNIPDEADGDRDERPSGTVILFFKNILSMLIQPIPSLPLTWYPQNRQI